MTSEQLEKQKTRLQEELDLLSKELSSIGQKNPQNLNDWEATQPDMNVVNADENEVADTIEEYEDNTAILKQLETRFNEVKNALKQIEDGTYGICKVCSKEIEPARLEANPAAQTCQEHME